MCLARGGTSLWLLRHVPLTSKKLRLKCIIRCGATDMAMWAPSALGMVVLNTTGMAPQAESLAFTLALVTMA